MTILGLCNFAAPGIWVAINSLGGGGEQEPYLVNTSNALTFCLMVLSCWFSGTFVHYIGIKGALVFGTLGFPFMAAGLFLNNKHGVSWLVIVGAALCGISAGVFWMAEAAIAIAYPEPWNRGKALGYWMTYRLAGQVLGGAINLGLNADRDEAGKVSATVFIIFITIECLAPFVGLLLNSPGQVEREDGKKVKLSIDERNPWPEIKRTTNTFLTKNFLLLILWIGQAVFGEAVYFTYLSLWFTVRARALGSFLSGIVAVASGNVLGFWLDRSNIPLKTRARWAFWTIAALHGGFWLWCTYNVTIFKESRPMYDWGTPGFGAAFGVFVLLNLSFHLNYMFLYFIMQHLSNNEEEVVRYSAILRATESAWQAISYGIGSQTIIAECGAAYINFGLWGIAIFPAWLVLRKIGTGELKSSTTEPEETTTEVEYLSEVPASKQA
ncbi:unnamed protein product [Clonostachys chloroleuca]|uniref:Uncharacterized protein n=1 Tax=Clonostachys chloroleuca TaxID=1926264 RepID=A0AA35LTW2_9HYPO|nr:unnamed protein product [Clonostachys chloroleuca]